MSQDYAELRPLGALEKYSYVRSWLGIYQNVCVTTKFSRRSDEPLRLALTQALAAVVAKHPILSAVPVGDLPNPRFVRLPSIDLDAGKVLIIDEAENKDDAKLGDEALDSEWDEIVGRQHNTPFRHGTPLVPFWRVYVRTNRGGDDAGFTLCFCFHHSLFDTQSSLIFLKDLEHALSNPSKKHACASSTILTSTELILPSMESMHSFPMSPDFMSRQDLASPPPSSLWSGLPQALPVETKFSSIWVPAAMTNRLVAAAREEQTSVTGILMSILAASCFSILPEEYTEINGDCAVSLRQFLPSPVTADSMGCYVGAFTQKYNRSSAALWDDSRQTKQIIRDLISNGAPDMSSTYLKSVADMESWLHGKIGTKRSASWEISNVGSLGPRKEVKTGSNNDYQMNSLLFSQSASACAGAIKVSVATGRDGRLSLGFTWQKGIVDDNTVREFMDKVMKLIQTSSGSR